MGLQLIGAPHFARAQETIHLALPSKAFQAPGGPSQRLPRPRHQLQSYKSTNEAFPEDLTGIPATNLTDPWGNAYEYLKIEGADTKSKGNMRKDKNLVPINSDFDLYSKGADGKSTAPLTASASRDDVVRANDGRYFGLGENY